MPKITYLDDNETPHRYRGKKNFRGKILVMVLIVSVVMGLAGGVGALLILSSSTALKNKLGINLQDLNISKTTTEKLVLEESSAITDAANKVSPAVVSITSTTSATDFFGQVTQSEESGTGFIFTNDGYILTNKHVGSDMSLTYSVFMADGKKYDGKVVAQDPSNDLAIMKIDATGLPVVTFGDSSSLQVGQWVIAIGNALGELQNTVTAGIISARERDITAGNDSTGDSENLENLLQTDAAINPGNSGGPLVNMAGQVVAIDTATSSSGQNLGFAIPINVAKTAIASFQKNGKIIRPQLGVSYVTVTPEISSEQKLSVDYGALIGGSDTNGVVSGSPADKAGLQSGDVITAINGTRIDQNNPLGATIQTFQPGDSVQVTYNRSGKDHTVSVKLGSVGN